MAGREGKDKGTGEGEKERVLAEILQGTWREGPLGNRKVGERPLAPQGDNEKTRQCEGGGAGDR